MNNWQTWVKGLAAAVVSAVANAVIMVIADPLTFSPSAAGGWKKLGTLALVNGIVGAAMYLKQSPITPLK